MNKFIAFMAMAFFGVTALCGTTFAMNNQAPSAPKQQEAKAPKQQHKPAPVHQKKADKKNEKCAPAPEKTM